MSISLYVFAYIIFFTASVYFSCCYSKTNIKRRIIRISTFKTAYVFVWKKLHDVCIFGIRFDQIGKCLALENKQLLGNKDRLYKEDIRVNFHPLHSALRHFVGIIDYYYYYGCVVIVVVVLLANSCCQCLCILLSSAILYELLKKQIANTICDTHKNWDWNSEKFFEIFFYVYDPCQFNWCCCYALVHVQSTESMLNISL